MAVEAGGAFSSQNMGKGAAVCALGGGAAFSSEKMAKGAGARAGTEGSGATDALRHIC